jgi:protein gp37
MSERTNIPWCDSTVNDWIGCTKVSPGCTNCYAEQWDRRMMIEKVIHWGPGAPRYKCALATKLRASLNRKPLVCDVCGNAIAWQGDEDMPRCDREVGDWGTPCGSVTFHRRRIFSLSQGDWLDEVPVEWLAEMLDSIWQAPDCYHLLLTKRPELWPERKSQLFRYLQQTRKHDRAFGNWLHAWHEGTPPENVWVGTTVEDQKRAHERIPALLKIPAKVRFLSCEPLLEGIDLKLSGIHWVIVGGESGSNARPCHVDWIRSIIRQCKVANVACFVKQLGAHTVIADTTRIYLKDPKGGDPAEFDGVERIGVPFEQTRYIPRDFRDVLTLDDFLRITDEWDSTEARRCELIAKRIKAGRRTAEEEAEFRRLQRLLTLHRRYFNPRPLRVQEFPVIC